jgi:hypothetical protein
LDAFAFMRPEPGESMAKLNYAKAKADIAEIVEIVKTVPEALQQRCFELLFEAAFSDIKPVAEPKPKESDNPAPEDKPQPQSAKRLPPNVMAFMRRQNITPDDLAKLFMLDHDPLLPVYNIPTSGGMAKSQLTKVMMVILENGLLHNSLSASYGELRSSARDDGFFDGNFNKLFKRDLFKGVGKDGVTDDTVIELSGTGMEKLAEVIRELAQ